MVDDVGAVNDLAGKMRLLNGSFQIRVLGVRSKTVIELSGDTVDLISYYICHWICLVLGNISGKI